MTEQNGPTEEALVETDLQSLGLMIPQYFQLSTVEPAAVPVGDRSRSREAQRRGDRPLDETGNEDLSFERSRIIGEHQQLEVQEEALRSEHHRRDAALEERLEAALLERTAGITHLASENIAMDRAVLQQ